MPNIRVQSSVNNSTKYLTIYSCARFCVPCLLVCMRRRFAQNEITIWFGLCNNHHNNNNNNNYYYYYYYVNYYYVNDYYYHDVNYYYYYYY